MLSKERKFCYILKGIVGDAPGEREKKEEEETHDEDQSSKEEQKKICFFFFISTIWLLRHDTTYHNSLFSESPIHFSLIFWIFFCQFRIRLQETAKCNMYMVHHWAVVDVKIMCSMIQRNGKGKKKHQTTTTVCIK